MLVKNSKDYAPAAEKSPAKKNSTKTDKKKPDTAENSSKQTASVSVSPLVSTGITVSDSRSADSAAAKEAKQKADNWSKNRPFYSGTKYSDEIDSLLQGLSDRQFSYDAESDPVYRAYRDSYTDRARLAMEDAIGKAASLTGGMGNSYAQSAGQQAFGNAVAKATDIIPELYKAAWGRYTDEGEETVRQIELMSQLDDDDFERYSEMLKNHLTEGKMLLDNYKNLSKNDWDRFYDYAKLLQSVSE